MRKIIGHTLLPLAAALGITVAARAAQDDDISKKIIDAPAPAAFQVYGAAGQPKPHKDAAVQGGSVLSVSVPAANAQAPYTTGLNVPILKPVKAGDHLVLAFWARLEKSDSGATTADIANAQVQLAAAPYTTVFGKPVTVGSAWKMYQVDGKADRDYPAGAINVAMHLATGKHVIAFGPIFLLDMGPQV